MQHSINIVVSSTGTLIGGFIRQILGGSVNHCSITLDENYDNLYSFSRRHPYLWFTGCFCKEDISRFKSYKIYSINITEEEYRDIERYIEYLNDRLRVYNYLGAIMIPFNIPVKFENSYICSTFVAKLLNRIDGIELDKPIYLYRPMDVLELLENNDSAVLLEA